MDKRAGLLGKILLEKDESGQAGWKCFHLKHLQAGLAIMSVLRLYFVIAGRLNAWAGVFFISKNPFDVIAVSETWRKPSTTNAEIDIPNYSISRNDRTNKSGGGKAFYVGNGLPFRTCGHLQRSHIETCWIEIIRPKTKSLFICSVYRAQDFNITIFIEKLNSDLSEIQENAEVYY